MRGVEVEVDRQVARAGGGATWLDFDSATQAFGLSHRRRRRLHWRNRPHLGGGIGHLTAQYGLTATTCRRRARHSSGSIVHANSVDNAELLWGLRGGGGNGVVTRLEFRLHPLERVVGALEYRGDSVADVLRRFRDLFPAATRSRCQAAVSVDET